MASGWHKFYCMSLIFLYATQNLNLFVFIPFVSCINFICEMRFVYCKRRGLIYIDYSMYYIDHLTLLEFERHKTQSGEIQLPVVTLPEVLGADNELIEQGNGSQGSGRARRDAASRAMQGWHAQRLFGSGDVGETNLKDKNPSTTANREKNLKSTGNQSYKPWGNAIDTFLTRHVSNLSARLVTTVVDVGPPADWVKINIRETEDCFELYALVPGLLREEVRVQSDPAGRLVITGQPEQLDNPWGVTPFRRYDLPARIDPVQTSAVVSLHGRLIIRVPFEQSTA
ncbi:AT-rich interactive domain-containing protein 5-like [Olea europaea var. sylvestris]|uniref:AT-rich interactive domain-containing protein 5-like n=1 Tax=Olea europaea var. sylvestris TaxID=158386 RepID=UPI000C1D0FE9|nr:AT-rich interactive domain-containing protein 5-like [Olea europaea var. sylvestris]